MAHISSLSNVGMPSSIFEPLKISSHSTKPFTGKHGVGFSLFSELTVTAKFNSVKVCNLTFARIQGRSELISHFQRSKLMMEDKKCRPVLFNESELQLHLPFNVCRRRGGTLPSRQHSYLFLSSRALREPWEKNVQRCPKRVQMMMPWENKM